MDGVGVAGGLGGLHKGMLRIREAVEIDRVGGTGLKPPGRGGLKGSCHAISLKLTGMPE
jgi:hypothetical protein